MMCFSLVIVRALEVDRVGWTQKRLECQVPTERCTVLVCKGCVHQVFQLRVYSVVKAEEKEEQEEKEGSVES